jgi:hypothetical protein
MPKYVGLIIRDDEPVGSARPGFSISLTVCPDDIGVSRDATNLEMVQALVNSIRARERQALMAEIKSLRDDVFAASTEADTAAERERKAIAAALRAASAPGAEPWALWIESSGPTMRDSDGKGLPLADWIEQGAYKTVDADARWQDCAGDR